MFLIQRCESDVESLRRFFHRGIKVKSRFAFLIAVQMLMLLGVGRGFAASDRIRIVLVGDSTVATSASPPKDRPDLTGWGQVFGEYFDSRVEVLNHARSGRSSKSFQREGLWSKALEGRPDFVLIQFGHNDCPGKGDRSTNPESDFRDYLRKYIDDAREQGTVPILVTPMTRRRFSDGKIQTILRPYAEAMIAVGHENKVDVIDLHAASVNLLNRLGDAGSADLSPSPSDRTHFSRKGAHVMARLIVSEIRKSVPSLKPYLRDRAE